MAFIFFLSGENPSRKFAAPIYTVDLLPFEKPAAAPSKAETIEKPVKPPAQAESKKAASMPAVNPHTKDFGVGVKEKAISLKKVKEPSLDAAIKKIEGRVKKRDAEEAINRAIEGLENKQLEKKIKEIRERVAHREGIVKSVQPPGMPHGGGAAKKSEDMEVRYGQLIGDIIHDKWNYPGAIQEGDSAVIDVRIDKSGRLIESRIEQSSSNVLLVQSAVRAIEKAAPFFPPLPQELGKDVVEIGVCFPRCEK
ncbi:MAG: cell envelope integrity protein TolA [Deltaproteobacteria bacterium]|nr:cell envelope integrity protein TolA [Deltaproteobacteria bacterium]